MKALYYLRLILFLFLVSLLSSIFIFCCNYRDKIKVSSITVRTDDYNYSVYGEIIIINSNCIKFDSGLNDTVTGSILNT